MPDTPFVGDIREAVEECIRAGEQQTETELDARIVIKGKHHIIDSFMSEIYGVSHYSFFDDPVEHSRLFVPTLLSPASKKDENSAYVGDNPYDIFGFEPYISIDNNSLFNHEGIYENYEVMLPAVITTATDVEDGVDDGSQDEVISVSYSPEVNCLISFFDPQSLDGADEAPPCVLFSYGYSDPTVISFSAGECFTIYYGNDKLSCPNPVYIHTNSISIKAIPVADGKKAYRISLAYTIRTSAGVCEESALEIEITPCNLDTNNTD